ncbi:MAG: HlyD family secretion protein, partial [Plesiomonas sp.]
TAVMQGATGHFVWVVNKESKAEYRPVTMGDYSGNDWIVDEGLAAGELVVVKGGMTLRPDALLAPTPISATPDSSGSSVGDSADKAAKTHVKPSVSTTSAH